MLIAVNWRTMICRLLVVDDDPSLLRALPEMLKLRLPHIDVDTVLTPEEAVSALRTSDYQVVLCDYTMPGGGGARVLETAVHECPWTPVIVMTGHLADTIASEALKAGAYDFVQKPVNRDLLAQAVRRAIEARYLRTSGTGQLVKNSVLCIEGLDASYTVLDMKELFSSYGRVVWARMVSNSNGQTTVVGFVEMASSEEARAAIAGLNGRIVAATPLTVAPSVECLRYLAV
jgi:DNA-binding NtrC family response regulator